MIRRGLFVACALVLTACGESDDDATDTVAPATTTTTTGPTLPPETDPNVTSGPQPGSTQPTVPPTVPPTPPPTEPRPTVGTVIEVVTPGGDVDGQTAESGDQILRAGVVTTESAGKIHFSVDEKIESCILRAQGQAVVVPGDGPLVRLVRGEATCRTRQGGGAVQIQAGGVQVVVSDPVFRLAVDEGGGLTNVGVAQGAVQVNGELLVGGQEAAWADGRLGEREAVQFDEDLAILGRSLPPVNYARPAGGSSPTWDAAIDRGALFVQVVQPDGGPATDLTAALLGPFGNVLGARVGVGDTDNSADVAAEALGGENELIVTNTPVDGLPSVLLFEADGSSWFAQAQPGDDGVIETLRSYLAGILQGPCPDGPGEMDVQAGELVCYVAQYQSASSGDAPATVPIDQFAGLLGL